MIQDGMAVKFVDGGDSARIQKVQPAVGRDRFRAPRVVPSAVGMEVQAVLNADPTRAPYVDPFGGLTPAAWFRRGDWVTTGSGVAIWNDAMGTENYLGLPGIAGNYASTPDSAATSVTGAIGILLDLALDDYTPSALTSVVANYTANTGYEVQLQTTGVLTFVYGNGSAARALNSTVACGITDGARKKILITRDKAVGVKFFLSDDGISWTQLGDTVATVNENIADSASALGVGGRSGIVHVSGKIYRARIYSDTALSTCVVDFNAADAAVGAASFASSTTGETWTVNATSTALGASIRRGNALLQGVDGARPQGQSDGSILFNGTDEFLKTAPFTLNQPTWVVMAVKQVSWTNADYVFDGGASNTIAMQQGPTSSPNLRFLTLVNTIIRTTVPIGEARVLSAILNGASSTFGVNLAPPGGPTDLGATNPGGFTLGANGNGSGGFSNIQAYEVALFPIAPSAAQEDRVIRYMAGVSGAAL